MHGRLYEADGTPVGPDFQISASSLGSQARASATALDDGGFLVAFETASLNDVFLPGARSSIAVRRFDVNGVAQTGDTLMVNTDWVTEDTPTLTRMGNGSVLLTWLEEQSSPSDILLKGMILDASGANPGTPFVIDNAGTPRDGNRTVTVLDDGNVMIAYTGLDDDRSGVFVRVYDQSGEAVTDPIRVNTETTGTQTNPVAVTLADGSVMVIWRDATSDMGDILGRRMAADGTALSDPVVLTASIAWDQTLPSLVALADGGFMIAYSTGYVGYKVMLRRFDADGVPIADETFISSDPQAHDTYQPKLLELANGQIAAIWLQLTSASASQVMMRLFEAQSFGTDGSETLSGTASHDWIDGRGSDDLIRGLDGDDLIFGGAGNDTLAGNGGKDTLHGGDGDDVMHGGAHNDQLDGDAGNDTLNGGDGNDVLRGGVGDDLLSGDLGHDTLAGNDGNDALNGGDGDDVLYGGTGNDTMNGDEGADTLFGGGGDDLLSGGVGNDQLWGDARNDTLQGGDGNDILRGGTGNDVLHGDGDNDTLAGNEGND